MPIYEFHCSSCQQRSSFLVRSQSAIPACPSCGSTELERLISAFAYHRSARDIHETSGDPDQPGPDYYKDPRNIGRWVEKRFQQMGMELPHEVKESIGKAREGVLPEAAKDLQPNVQEL